MRCPRCDVPVVIVEHHEIELDHCLACAGVWFDGEELALLFAKAQIDITPDLASILAEPALDEDTVEREDEAWLDCPRCGDRMDKIAVGDDANTRVDRCDAGCGLWFDGGELRDMMRHLNDATEGALERAVAFVEEVFPVDDGPAEERA